jgi:hypothetical protein
VGASGSSARMGLRSIWFPLPGYLSGVLLSFPAVVGEAPWTLSPHRGGLPLPGRGIATLSDAVGGAYRASAAFERHRPLRNGFNLLGRRRT